jgi:hypothetical protein
LLILLNVQCIFLKSINTLNMPSSTSFLDQSESQKRQFIDAETVFLAVIKAKKAAAEVRGSMLWRELRGKSTLIRTSSNSAQKSLGPRSAETEAIYANFMARKKSTEDRLKALKSQLATQQRLNRALRVGRVPNVVVGVLNALESMGVQEHFMVVGTHALYAYETAAGVRIAQEAMATRDVDMLFDTRKHLSFFTAMKKLDSSLIGLLRKVDPSFEVVDDQLYTARNQDGFEVDIIRRAAKDADPHPLRMSDEEDDFWAVQVSMGVRPPHGPGRGGDVWRNGADAHHPSAGLCAHQTRPFPADRARSEQERQRRSAISHRYRIGGAVPAEFLAK